MQYAIENNFEHKATVWCFTSEDIFERVLMPAPDQVAFKRTIEHTYHDYIKEHPNISKEEYETIIRKEFRRIADKYRSHYNFRD